MNHRTTRHSGATAAAGGAYKQDAIQQDVQHQQQQQQLPPLAWPSGVPNPHHQQPRDTKSSSDHSAYTAQGQGARQCRADTLELAFQSFLLEQDEPPGLAGSAPFSALSPPGDNGALRDDALLALLLMGDKGRAMSIDEHEQLWLPSGPMRADPDPFFAQPAAAAPAAARGMLGGMPAGMDVGVAAMIHAPIPPIPPLPPLETTPFGGLPMLPMEASPSPPMGAGMHAARTAMPAPAPGMPAAVSHKAHRYASALTSALQTSLGLELAPTDGARATKAVAAKVAAFKQRLEDLLTDCLVHLGYTSGQARNISQGAHGSLTDVEAHTMEMVLGHLNNLVALYAATLRNSDAHTTNSTGSSSGAPPATATAAPAGSASRGANTRSATGSARGPPIPPPPGSANVDGGATLRPSVTSPPPASSRAAAAGAAASVMASGYRATLALGLETDAQLANQFHQQLVQSACQLWAMMNVLQPHPSRQVKESLAAYTGRNMKQVVDWFTNWRARHWKKLIKNL